MTVLEDAPAPPSPARTATGPTVRTVARAGRGPLLVALALVVTALGAAAFYATGEKGLLDPSAYNPSGAHAIAQLLADGGVPVRRVETVDAVQADEGSTVLVPLPQALSDDELTRLASMPGELVVVGADRREVTALGAAVEVGPPVPVEERRPACRLPAAERAGSVDIGGSTYGPTGAAEVVSCYASSGRATLVRLPAQRLTLLGSGDLLTNDRLDRRGNAALALGLLGTQRDVQWVLPRPGARDVDSGTTLNELLPRGLKLAAWQLLLAVGVLALWRARRLGPVVTEPLPVVVRAAESVEGRSRLYRAARARGTAADALRAGARDRVARRLGLPTDAGRTGVVAAVSARTGRDPAATDALLYGAAPGDDAALVRLADDLDLLLREVAGT